MKPVYAWHFLPLDKKLRYGDGREVRAQRTLKVDEAQLKPCGYGLHASLLPLDAINYAPGPVVCRVKLSGKILTDTDKLCASERKVLWLADATKVLHLFACEVAERALNREVEQGRKPDRRLFDAILTKRNWLEGKATDAELSAAWSAAYSAADSAAYSAAWSAAYSAAWSAAYSAADRAADSAAWIAAYRAADRAARSAAWSAADSAEIAWQNQLLDKMLRSLKPNKE